MCGADQASNKTMRDLLVSPQLASNMWAGEMVDTRSKHLCVCPQEGELNTVGVYEVQRSPKGTMRLVPTWKFKACRVQRRLVKESCASSASRHTLFRASVIAGNRQLKCSAHCSDSCFALQQTDKTGLGQFVPTGPVTGCGLATNSKGITKVSIATNWASMRMHKYDCCDLGHVTLYQPEAVHCSHNVNCTCAGLLICQRSGATWWRLWPEIPRLSPWPASHRHLWRHRLQGAFNRQCTRQVPFRAVPCYHQHTCAMTALVVGCRGLKSMRH